MRKYEYAFEGGTSIAIGSLVHKLIYIGASFSHYYSITDDLTFLINSQFAHYIDSTIHQCKVTQRETLEAQRTPPKLECFTDGEIYEMWDYYGTEGMTMILHGQR